MLCTRLTDPSRLDDPGYVAEPKLDGQRAQIHVASGRAVHVYSRPGRELLNKAGLTELRDARWPFPAAILDTASSAPAPARWTRSRSGAGRAPRCSAGA
jgi:ATP-dependent DNA ligase